MINKNQHLTLQLQDFIKNYTQEKPNNLVSTSTLYNYFCFLYQKNTKDFSVQHFVPHFLTTYTEIHKKTLKREILKPNNTTMRCLVGVGILPCNDFSSRFLIKKADNQNIKPRVSEKIMNLFNKGEVYILDYILEKGKNLLEEQRKLDVQISLRKANDQIRGRKLTQKLLMNFNDNISQIGFIETNQVADFKQDIQDFLNQYNEYYTEDGYKKPINTNYDKH